MNPFLWTVYVVLAHTLHAQLCDAARTASRALAMYEDLVRNVTSIIPPGYGEVKIPVLTTPEGRIAFVTIIEDGKPDINFEFV